VENLTGSGRSRDLGEGAAGAAIERGAQVIRCIGLRSDVAAADIRVIRLGESRGSHKGGKRRGGDEHLHDTSPCCCITGVMLPKQGTVCPCLCTAIWVADVAHHPSIAEHIIWDE